MHIVKLLALLSALFSVVPTASAAAGPACYFDVYQPEAMVAELMVGLPASGIAVVNLNRDVDATSSRMLLVRDGRIVGELYSSVDVRAAKSEMTVLSAAGDVLLHMQAAKSPCSTGRKTGLCSKVDAYTELEGPLDGRAAYSIHAAADGSSPSYYRYDVAVNRLEFRRALISSIDWLTSTLDATDITREPVSVSAEERFYWKLAALPSVAPYLDRLTIETRRGSMLVSGIVPSTFVYDAIVRAALDAEIWHVVPDLAIDTRTDIADRRWVLSRCL